MIMTGSDQTLLGIDYGEANIGLALGRNGLTSPLKTLSGKNEGWAIEGIVRTAIENRVALVIVGLPLSYDGKETTQSRRVREFVNKLKIYLKKPFEYVSEYESTKQSLESAVESGMSKKRRRDLDALSAAMIIKNYYEENA